VLHSTSICFICAHFTAGQNEYNERNKDYKTIMEKLSFQPPSRALWHDHIFFLGDFNYRLTIPRNQVEQFVKNECYPQLLEYDQLKKEHSGERVSEVFLFLKIYKIFFFIKRFFENLTKVKYIFLQHINMILVQMNMIPVKKLVHHHIQIVYYGVVLFLMFKLNNYIMDVLK
jgi:hypothetical protein